MVYELNRPISCVPVDFCFVLSICFVLLHAIPQDALVLCIHPLFLWLEFEQVLKKGC